MVRDAAEIWGFTPEELGEPSPPKPKGPCDRCPHLEHIGQCGVEVQKHGVTQDCACFTPTASSLDRHRLRVAVVEQEWKIRDALRPQRPL